MSILFVVCLLIYVYLKIITKHKGFFNFLRILLLAYKEAFRSVYLFFKLEFFPYFTGKTSGNKPYDYTLWIRWKWKFFDKTQFIFKKFFYLWFFLMFLNIYHNGSIIEIFNLVTGNWFYFFIFLCKIPVYFDSENFFFYFSLNLFKSLNLFI